MCCLVQPENATADLGQVQTGTIASVVVISIHVKDLLALDTEDTVILSAAHSQS